MQEENNSFKKSVFFLEEFYIELSGLPLRSGTRWLSSEREMRPFFALEKNAFISWKQTSEQDRWTKFAAWWRLSVISRTPHRHGSHFNDETIEYHEPWNYDKTLHKKLNLGNKAEEE